MSEQTPLLVTRAICKSYSGVAVLKSVDFTLLPAQIHALMGGNGAGKSTLMKIIAGVQSPDSGEIQLEQHSLRRLKPSQAHAAGIYLVAQEPMLFADLTVQENILFRLPGKRPDQQAKLQQILSQLDCHLNLQAAAGTLEVADSQMVEILRGLMRRAKILILDEPTSSLTPAETAHLFRQIRILQATGVGIIFISHKLPEIRALANHISLMRDGKMVLSGAPAEISDSQLIQAMTPRPDQSPDAEQKLWLELPGQKRHANNSQPILQVENATGEGFCHISFSIQPGEIVGLAGLVGSGRTELAESLYGLRSLFAGSIRLQGLEISAMSVKQRLRHGLVYLPEDRQTAGLFVDASVRWNTVLLRDLTFWQQPKREAAIVERYRRALGIKFHQPEQPVRTLSGGNQQKILLARCLEAQPRLLIVDEPTRGVDVAAREDIYQLLNSIAAQGVAILMISSDVAEFPGLAHRVMVMHQGSLSGELSRESLTVDRMMELAFGGQHCANPVT